MLRMAAEVFADPKVENEVSDDEKWVKARKKVVQEAPQDSWETDAE